MSAPLKPLADRIIAQHEGVEKKSASSLVLPEAAKEKSIVAVVLAVGPEVKYLKVGDRIVYKQYAESLVELKLDGKDYISIREPGVVATLN